MGWGDFISNVGQGFSNAGQQFDKGRRRLQDGDPVGAFQSTWSGVANATTGGVTGGKGLGNQLNEKWNPGDPEPLPEMPTAADPEVKKAKEKERRRATGGAASQILTGGSGIMGRAPTARTTLLGS